MGSTPGIVDNSNATAITIDSSENVGIGATTPAAAYGTDTVLEIKGDTSPGLVINDTGQGSKYGIHADSDNLKITYGANVLATFQQNGNVGIGTTSPNSYSGYTALTLNHATNGGLLDFELNGTLQGEIYANSANLGLGLQAAGNRSIKFLTNSVERMIIDADGNVGIGTDSPTLAGIGYRGLGISGPTGQGASITLKNAAGHTSYLYTERTGNDLLVEAPGDVVLRAAGVEKVRIDSTGLVAHDSGTVYTGAGTAKGTIHLDPNSATNFAGNAITFGASDAGAGQTAQAGIYTRTDGTLGSEMHLSTTDSYAAGSQTGIKISNLGNVTVPRGYMSAKQPAAIARGVGTWQTSYTAAGWNELHTLCAFTSIANSVGSPWSNSTGRFTAPIAGYYLCSMSLYANNSASSAHGATYIHPMWAKNGSTNIHGVAPYQIYGYNNTAADNYADGIGRTDIVYCAAGDYITGQLYMGGANWRIYKNYAAISFCLLSAS